VDYNPRPGRARPAASRFQVTPSTTQRLRACSGLPLRGRPRRPSPGRDTPGRVAEGWDDSAGRFRFAPMSCTTES
jgi:hypothetical protein